MENNEVQFARNEAAVQQRLAAMFSANKDEITIPKIYIDMTGDFKAAAVLDEIMFWTLPKRGGRTSLRVFRNGSLWLAVRRNDWWERKRLTERQSDTAIDKLIELDLVEKDVFLFDGKPTVHLRMKMSNFVRLYGDKIQEMVGQEEDEDLSRDIADLYEMMGFPIHENVISNLQNGEMLNLQNGEFINSLQQPPNTSIETPENSNSAKESIQARKERMRKNLAGKSLDPAWPILAGEEVDTSANILAKEAMDAFEVAFDGMKIPWGETKDWKEFQDFVVRVYTQDKTERRKNGNCWTDYCLWRKNEGQYGKAMTNLAIRRRPRDFMDVAWPTFLAHSAMYGKKTSEPDLDDSGAPISY